MDNFLLFLLLWGVASALYVLPGVISSLIWWKPKVGRWYRNKATQEPYLVKELSEWLVFCEDRRDGVTAPFSWPSFRALFERKPLTIKTQAKGYAQSAKKLSKKRLTYRELQSRNALLDNEVKRLHAEVKVLRVNPKLKSRFGPKEVSTGIQKDALKCAKDLRECTEEIKGKLTVDEAIDPTHINEVFCQQQVDGSYT